MAAKELSKFIFNDFSGGMRRNVSPTLIANNEYTLLINARSRYGTLRPVKLPLKISGGLPPSGLYQGCYGAGSRLLVFVAGKTYVRDFSVTDSSFVRYPETNFEATQPIIYAVLLPDSTVNYKRKPINLGTGASERVEFTDPITGSPLCILAQDGVNQPELLFTDGTHSRKAYTIDQWNKDGVREYVPIGKQMLYHDGICYIVAKDGKKIFRSVTGRPLDFVIAVDQTGDRIRDNAFAQEAGRWSHRVGFDPITFIGSLNETPQSQNLGIPFVVCTENGSWRVTPNYASTIFSEPKLLNTPLFATGAVNQFSFSFIKGDSTFIDQTGARIFSTLSQDFTVTKDEALTGSIYKYFEGVVQDPNYSSCIFSDNYVIYALQTIFGPSLLFWDSLRNKFDAIDIYPNVSGKIKMLAQIKVDGKNRIFFITSNNELFELYGSIETAEMKLYTKEYTEAEIEMEIKMNKVSVSVQEVFESGEITVTDFVDGRRGTTLSESVETSNKNPVLVSQVPLGDDSVANSDQASFKFQNSLRGGKIAPFLTMNFDAEITGIEVAFTPMDTPVGKEQQARLYKNKL